MQGDLARAAQMAYDQQLLQEPHSYGKQKEIHLCDEDLKHDFFLKKKVLITGASSGIGRALAYWYLNHGAKVALVGRDIKEMNEVASNFPGQSLAVQCNLTVDQQLLDLKQVITERFGGLDILINCAGVIFNGDVESTFPQDFDYLMDINLRTPFILTQFFSDFLHKAPGGGVVINVSCMKGQRPEAGMIGYCMTKAGLEMFTKSAAMELAPFGIRVNAVAASTTDTNLYRYSGMNEQEWQSMKKRAAENNPLQRIAKDHEVAKSIIFLTSESALKITGHVMKVDGGMSLTSRGQGCWYGMKYMTRKFEQESLQNKLNFKVQQFLNPGTDKTPIPTDFEARDEWCEAVQVSSWAIKTEQAHLKQNAQYENKEEDLQWAQEMNQQHKQGGAYNPKMAK